MKQLAPFSRSLADLYGRFVAKEKILHRDFYNKSVVREKFCTRRHIREVELSRL
jgi:hypothetical protein